MLLRQHRHHTILIEQPVTGREDSVGVRKAEVDLSIVEPLGNFVVFALAHHEAHTGILRGKGLDALRQVGAADAGERAEADFAVFQLQKLRPFAAEPRLGCGDLLNIGQIALPVACERQTMRFAADECCAKLLLKRLDSLADGALRIIQRGGCSGEAPALYHRAEDNIFGYH